MTEELYERLETDMAKAALVSLTERLPGPFVLLGGWAVYVTVTRSFDKAHGSSYLGSRDVDLGFHLDPNASIKDLKQDTFARAIALLEKMGYSPIGTSRYCKWVHRESGKVLSENEAKAVPVHDLFYLYVDLMVDIVHPAHAKALKIKAIDEPLLARAFSEKLLTEHKLERAKVLVPEPDILLAMKMKAIPARQKDDKRLKDACDIYALLWHSPVDPKRVLSKVRTDHPEICKGACDAITDQVAADAAGHIGIDVVVYLDVVRRLGE